MTPYNEFPDETDNNTRKLGMSFLTLALGLELAAAFAFDATGDYDKTPKNTLVAIGGVFAALLGALCAQVSYFTLRDTSLPLFLSNRDPQTKKLMGRGCALLALGLLVATRFAFMAVDNNKGNTDLLLCAGVFSMFSTGISALLSMSLLASSNVEDHHPNNPNNPNRRAAAPAG